ncbi:hypothetical protein L3X38_041091 [Prunus dulcis]|uniref:Uncharacterized protein n=1 Tax=Prunus dulcis TaxID=3755 RepID=A0AAD4YKL0_PRUDU|nr:hypothetical protein L3X38_041091 [Prunus dulcis]
MGERLKRGQCTRLNLATKTEKEINLKFQESRKESFAVHGINLELWGLYGDLSLFPSGASPVTSRDQLRRSTILSALGSPLCPHGFVSGSSRATSQWVTHPGIALAPNSLNFGVPMTPKPVSSQKASC